MKTNDFTFVKKFSLALIAFFISLLNEYYLRVVANYYVSHFYKSLVPKSLYHSFMDNIYGNLDKLPFLVFLLLQSVLIMLALSFLSKLLKLKSNLTSISFSTLGISILSFLTVIPRYPFLNEITINSQNNLISALSAYMPMTIHFLLITFFFYYFSTKKYK